MTAERTKVCEKKLKNAELKLNKILNKIDVLKLNNYYLSDLDVHNNNKKWYFRGLNGKLKRCLFFGTTLLLVGGLWWFFFVPFSSVSYDLTILFLICLNFT